MTRQFSQSRRPWLQPIPVEMTDREAEHRFTSLEQTTDLHGKRLDDHHQRMSYLEKAIMTIAGGLYVALQDKFPAIAHLIKMVLIP
jgi:hypothetical protein